jgi:META domain
MELTGWRLVLNVALAAMTRLSRHHVSGSGGCNRLMGSYEAKGAQLTFARWRRLGWLARKGWIRRRRSWKLSRR